MKQIGSYDFAGSCSPQGGRCFVPFQRTFSVGCFRWTASARGEPKKGRVEVRVSGPVDRWADVEAKAREICLELDAGTYTGPKNVKIERRAYGELGGGR